LIAVLKRWVIATTTAMDVLRAMALGNCGVGSSDKDGCGDSGGDDDDDGGKGIGDVTIALAALAIAHFVSRKVVANAIACVVAVAIAFVSVQQRG
jgi:hypothetical protein